MPVYKKVNKDFFKKWTPEMAYVLGFFAADGNMVKGSRGNHYISFHITDKELLCQIRKVMGSNHKIAIRVRDKRWKTGYRLQIGSKELFEDLLELGMTANKSASMKFPRVQRRYMSDFVRGYFDGDGHVQSGSYERKDRGSDKRNKLIFSGFVSGSKAFLPTLHKNLKKEAGIVGGSLHSSNNSWRLSFSTLDSLRLYEYMYNSLANNLFLNRKKKVFEHFISQR